MKKPFKMKGFYFLSSTVALILYSLFLQYGIKTFQTKGTTKQLTAKSTTAMNIMFNEIYLIGYVPNNTKHIPMAIKPMLVTYILVLESFKPLSIAD